MAEHTDVKIIENDGGKIILSKKMARIVGAAVVALAIIGVISIIAAIISLAGHSGAKARAAEILRAEQFIAPAVAVDAGEFDSAENISNYTLLRSAAVCSIMNNKDTLEPAEDGRMSLPHGMIEKSAKMLFGDKIKIKYVSFDINGLLFEYDRANERYCFFASGHAEQYSPKITTYIKKDGIITATVKYVPADGETGTTQGTKTYEYTISENEKHALCITGIKKLK